VTDPSARSGRLHLLSRTRSAGFRVRVVLLPPGSTHEFQAREWLDCLVEIESGAMELHLRGGTTRTYQTGAVLWLFGLPIVTLGNSGPTATVLVAISRRHTDRPELESKAS
jgi:hypothetical protein